MWKLLFTNPPPLRFTAISRFTKPHWKSLSRVVYAFLVSFSFPRWVCAFSSVFCWYLPFARDFQNLARDCKRPNPFGPVDFANVFRTVVYFVGINLFFCFKFSQSEKKSTHNSLKSDNSPFVLANILSKKSRFLEKCSNIFGVFWCVLVDTTWN